MNTKQIALFGMVSALAALSAAADGFSASAGYAWRSRVRTKFERSATPPGGAYDNGSLAGNQNWTYAGAYENTRYADQNYTPAEPIYSMGLVRSEGVVDASDDSGAHGLNLSAAYGLWSTAAFELALQGRFAGFWDIENAAAAAGVTYTDYYSFGPLPVDPTADEARFEERVQNASAPHRVRLRADLYQIGLGPKATWHALSWLDVYAGADVLLNIAHASFSTDAGSSSDTDCLIGFGGNMGVVGRITKNVGIYGQIGYEWIDDSDMSAGGYRAETDYSSLVLSAGVQFRF